MHHPTDRIIHTTAFVTPVVEHWLEREIAQWIRRPIQPCANALTTELHLAPTHTRGMLFMVARLPWRVKISSGKSKPYHVSV